MTSSGFLAISKRQKWGLYVFIFLVIVSVGVVHMTEYLAGKILQSQVEQYTGGVYSLTYSDMKIKWIHPQIILKDVEYGVKEGGVDSVSSSAYDFTVTNLDIRIKSIWDIYFSKELHVYSLFIDNPQLEIRKQTESSVPSTFSFESGQLYEMLRGFVSTFKMDEIRVDHMHLTYFRFGDQIPFTINDLSFSIQNILIDSASVTQKSQFLFSESFDLKIRDQQFLFADSVHFSTLDSLHLSTANNYIKLYGFQTDTLDGSQDIMSRKRVNRYYSDMPYMAIVGLDFNRAYHDNILHVDSMIFRNPHLQSGFSTIQRDINPVQIDTTVENNLVEMVLSVFNKVELEHFLIDNSKMQVVYGDNDTASVQGLDLIFSEFILDSNDLFQEVYYPNFEDLELSVDHPKLKLPNQNVLSAGKMTFSTAKHSLVIQDVFIQNSASNPRQSVEGTIEQIKLNGIHPREIFEKRELHLDTLLLVRPDLLWANNSVGKSSTSTSPTVLFEKLSEYSISHILIEEGNVGMKDSKNRHGNYGVEGLNIHFRNFVVNENILENPPFLFSDWVEIDCRSGSVFLSANQHDIEFKNTHFDTRKKQIRFNDLTMKPQVVDSSILKSLINLNVAFADVEGLNVNALQHMENLDVSSLKIHDVNLNVTQIRKDSSQSDFLSKLKKMDIARIQNLEIENINVSVNTDSTSVFHFSEGFLLANELSVLLTDKDTGVLKLKSDGLTYGASKITVPLHSAEHIITIQDLSRNLDSSLTISGFSMRPIPGVSMADTAFKGVVYVPYMELQNFNSLENRYSDTLDFGALTVRDPSVRIHSHPKSDNKTPFELSSRLKNKLFDGQISAVSLAGLVVENGKLLFESDSTQIELGNVDIHSTNWFISDSTTWEKQRFLWAEDFGFRIAGINYSTSVVENCPSVDSITYEFSDEKLGVYGLYYANDPYEEEDSVSLYLPQIQFVRPDIYAYLTDSALIMDSLRTSNGLFEVAVQAGDKNPEDSVKSKGVPMQIPERIGGFSRVAVHHIALDHMHYQMTISGKENIAPLDIDEFNFHVDSLHFTPNEKMDSNRLFWADDIALEVDNIYTTLDDGLYEFGADKFRISSKEKRVDLENVSFVPSVFRYEYALYKGHQKDVFTIYSKGIGISDLDYFSLLNNEGIVASSLVIEKTSMDILKDKRIPVAPFKYKKTIPELFKHLPIKISLDSIAVNDLRIRYEEFPEVGRAPGTINLSKMNILAKNVTNDTALLKEDSTLVIQMNALLLDNAALTFEADYNMLSPNNEFAMSTTVGELDATQFNSFVEPVYFAKINSGSVDRLDMNVIGNDSVSGGKMGLYYEDLKFSFLDEVSMEKEGFSAKIKSAIGNTLVKQKNKYHAFKRREPVFFVRDTSKGWIGYLIRIHLSGISSSVGLKKHKKDLKKTNKDLWKEFDKNDKKVRKERAKQERKEARKSK